MITLSERIQYLVNGIDEQEEREQKSKELRQLADDFSYLNKKLKKVVPTSRFVLELTKDEQLSEKYAEVKDSYFLLKKELSKIWGIDGEKIEVLETVAFSEAVNALTDFVGKLESISSNAFLSKVRETKEEQSIVDSFCLIPDFEIERKPFIDAENFLKNFEYLGFSDFVGDSKEKFDARISTWKNIQKELASERLKMDLKNIDGNNISSNTHDFIKKFVDNREVSFELLDGKTVDELKKKFPELSKKLRVIIS